MTSSSTIVDQIKKHFDYLFIEYGFQIISETHFESFGNWAIVLQSDACRLRFFNDRGEVFIAASPLWSPPSWQAGPWYDLASIVAFLTQGKEKLELEPKLGEIEQQLMQATEVFRIYCDQIIESFREDTFQKNQSELELFKDQLDEQYWDHFRR